MAVKIKKKKTGKKTVVRSFRPLLKEIADFLNVGDDESQSLWMVLTALRGPDSEDHEEKCATTGLIRKSLGLNADKLPIDDFKTDCPEFLDIRAKLPFHFGYHTREAFNVLGLKWREVNQ